MIEYNNFAIFLKMLKQILHAAENSLIRNEIVCITANDVVVKLWAFVDEIPAHEVIKYFVLGSIFDQELPKSYHLRQIADFPIEYSQ